MIKYFGSSKEYFKFINDKKDKIRIEKVKILKERIKVVYFNIK